MFKSKPSVKVINPPLANDAVTTDKIAEKAVTEDKMSDDALAWHITDVNGLSHPARAVWAENAGSGLVFCQYNKASYDTADYVMKSDGVVSSYALFLPNLTVNLAESAPAGSTSYVLSTNLFWDNVDASWILDVPFAWDKDAGAKLATSYTINENSKVVLTFAESLNPSAATTKLLGCVKLNSQIYGGFFTGAALSCKGQTSFVGGLFVKNDGSQSFVNGRGIHNTGGRSAIVGERIKNGADRAYIFGKDMQNAKIGSFLAGLGHVVGAECGENVAAFGAYSNIGADTAFAIGNGTDNDHRANLFEIKNTGAATINGEAIPLVRKGEATYSAPVAEGYGDLAITFATPFPTGKIPTVTCSLAASSISGADNVSLWILKDTITETGFTVRFFNNYQTGITPSVEYIAIA